MKVTTRYLPLTLIALCLACGGPEERPSPAPRPGTTSPDPTAYIIDGREATADEFGQALADMVPEDVPEGVRWASIDACGSATAREFDFTERELIDWDVRPAEARCGGTRATVFAITNGAGMPPEYVSPDITGEVRIHIDATRPQDVPATISIVREPVEVAGTVLEYVYLVDCAENNSAGLGACAWYLPDVYAISGT